MTTLASIGRPLLACLLMSLVGGVPAIAADAVPTIRIVEPADGAAVTSPIAVRVEVSNFHLEAPGSGKGTNAGHIHYWIDDRTNAMTYPATTKTSVRLLVEPGRHKIRAELVLDDHTSLAEGYRGKRVQTLPTEDHAFERRPSIATITVDVR
jgi:hypothetical protein